MPSCVMRHCRNYTSKTNKSLGITYHSFPKPGTEERKAWIKFIRMERSEPMWVPSITSRVCSDHFKEDDKYTSKTGRAYLKKTAMLYDYGDFYTQHISKDSENSSTNTRSQLLPMVAKVYLYLEKEYEYMKTLNGSNCDLSPLADILKRTAEATGVSEEDVITTLENEDLSDHLPERAKKLRQTIEDLQDGSDDGLISDEEMQEEEHADIEVQKEKIGEGTSEPTPCGSTVIHIPSEQQTKTQSEQVCLKEIRDTSHAEYGDRCVTSDTQVKVEPEEDEVATSVNNLLLQLEPPGTNATVSSDDGNKMEIEQYTFIICNPSEKPTTSNPEDTAVKLEPLDD